MPQRGDILELTPEKLIAGGDALARLEGLPIFVPGVFPGDRARVRLTEVKKGYARGELLELLEPGSGRRRDPCPIAGSCGGCDWTALRLDLQLQAKREIVLETLSRVGKLTDDQIRPMVIHPSPLNYRLRSRLHVDRERQRVGFFAPRSHEVVDLTSECEVVGPQTIENLDQVKALALESGSSSVGLFEERTQLRLEPFDDEPEGEEVEVSAGEFHWTTSTAGFFQVNRHLLGTLIERVSAIAAACRERKLALDLYGGVGFFALPLSKIFERVVSVESSPLAHRLARKNAGAEPRFEPVRDSVERFVARTKMRPSFIMLDPPRAGVTAEVMDRLNALSPERIGHLSCDPVTFARDAARLMQHGWKLAGLELVDLFPNTHHIETLASFEPM